MILLSKLLLEIARAPIYHTTEIGPAIAIVNSDTLARTTLEWKEPIGGIGSTMLVTKLQSGGVSFTRDKRYRVRGNQSSVVFELDSDKLRQSYKMKPRVGADLASGEPLRTKREEAEEVVRGPIKPLSKYLITIYIDSRAMKKVKESLVAAKRNYEYARSKKSVKGMSFSKKHIEELTKFLSHPKLKIGSP